MAPVLELLVFMSVAPASLHFHTLIFYCLSVPQVQWKMN